IRARVDAARDRQAERGGPLNAALPGRQIMALARASGGAGKLLARSGERLHLSARGFHRVVRVARTIADLAGEECLGEDALAAAPRGALAGGGSTVAVLGCGIDVCYPSEHAALRDEIAAHGCVISEEPPRMPPLKHNFPKRNRLIAALVSAVVVVEAAPRSGAL